MKYCIEDKYFSLSHIWALKRNGMGKIGGVAIAISEHCPSDQFEISGKIIERPFNNVSMKQMSGPDVIDGIYWIHSPDDETLLIIIDDLKGNVHMISNDWLYIQSALTKYVFRSRQHYHQYYDECDIEIFNASPNSDSKIEVCYYRIFDKEMKLFFLLKENGINFFY